MQLQNPSQILKSELRGTIASDSYNCFSTFNYLSYQEESRNSFGSLSILNDETLAPKKSIDYTLEEDQTIVLIPLVGALDVIYLDTSEFVTTNQIRVFSAKKGTHFTISNPYEKELINFIQLRFRSTTIISETISFTLENRNSIISITQNEYFSIGACILDARSEGFHSLKNKNYGIFAFVLSGAFEFQNRLIENRDGLKIWNIDSIEFEALSENAILLIIDVLL